ncbi:MAG: hypothetical protein JRN67_05220 [Nitrososphaerota archaeon]|nr:hypothetical protein [Nitrososphaerota archaeon]
MQSRKQAVLIAVGEMRERIMQKIRKLSLSNASIVAQYGMKGLNLREARKRERKLGSRTI